MVERPGLEDHHPGELLGRLLPRRAAGRDPYTGQTGIEICNHLDWHTGGTGITWVARPGINYTGTQLATL